MIGPTLEQPIYDILRDLSTTVAEAEAGEAEAEPPVEFLAMEDAPDPEDLPPASCVVFDDCMLEINKSAASVIQPRKAPRRRCPMPDPEVYRGPEGAARQRQYDPPIRWRGRRCRPTCSQGVVFGRHEPR